MEWVHVAEAGHAGLGAEVPQWGPGAKPRQGVCGRSPSDAEAK